MLKVNFATSNEGKVRSLKNVLAKYDIYVAHINMDLLEPRSDSVEVIAKAKVIQAVKILQSPTIALDAGFYIHSLGGFPGSYVNLILKNSRFGLAGILKLVEGNPRECEFRECLAYFDWNADLEQPMAFESSITGILSDYPREVNNSDGWSELHRIFIPSGYEKTLSEFTPEEYDTFRHEIHKNSYLAKFAEWFKEYARYGKG